jgi:hypothetical protein
VHCSTWPVGEHVCKNTVSCCHMLCGQQRWAAIATVFGCHDIGSGITGTSGELALWASTHRCNSEQSATVGSISAYFGVRFSVLNTIMQLKNEQL